MQEAGSAETTSTSAVRERECNTKCSRVRKTNVAAAVRRLPTVERRAPYRRGRRSIETGSGCAPAQQAGQRQTTRCTERQRCEPCECVGSLRRDVAKCMRATRRSKSEVDERGYRGRECNHDVPSSARHARRSRNSTSADGRKKRHIAEDQGQRDGQRVRTGDTAGNASDASRRSATMRTTRLHWPLASSEEMRPSRQVMRAAGAAKATPTATRERERNTTCSRVHGRRSHTSTSADSRETRATSSETKIDVTARQACRKGRPDSVRRHVASSGNDAHRATMRWPSPQRHGKVHASCERPARQRRRRLARPRARVKHHPCSRVREANVAQQFDVC
jgi:hypothetical protein